MLIKYCPNCRKPMPYGHTYCSACENIVKARVAQQRAKRLKEYNRNRDRRYVNFYQSADWKRLSAKKLSDSGYLCEVCKTKGEIKIAEEVHHIVPVKVDWNKRLDYNNLLAVCMACHKRIEPKGQGDRKSLRHMMQYHAALLSVSKSREMKFWILGKSKSLGNLKKRQKMKLKI